MKKIVLLAFVSLLLLSVLGVIYFAVSVRAEPKTIYVDAGNVGDPLEDGSLDHPFDKIREGVDATSPGDKVFVYGGTYYELDIVLDKDNLSLVGESRNNTIIDGQGYGSILKIDNAHNITITGFTIQNSPRANGIRLLDSTRNNINNNIITKCDSGIYAHFSNGNVIENNWVSDNYAGIILSNFCRENRISNNDVIGNTIGIYLSNHAHQNEVRNNKIIQNTYGVSISYDDNSIFGNKIIDNNVGIYESGPAQGYKIFRNNLINNTKQIDLGSQSPNIWDNGLEGNYWSNYNGTDFNQDGIGDTSYIIDENNTDHYPLMGTFSDFPVTLEEQTYHVTTICNSTISAFQFDQVNKTISFNVTGPHQSLGFCRVTIPNIIVQEWWKGNYTVLVDGEEPITINNWTDETYTYIYFTYIHSTHEVTIIPEIPIEEVPPPPPFWLQWWFWAIIAVGIVVLAVAVFFLKKRKPPTPIH